MSSQTTDEQTAGQHTKPYRQVIALALLGVAVLGFLWHVLGLLLPDRDAGSFTDRAAGLLYSEFIGVVVVGLPVVAVLIASHVAPVLQRAKAITLGALALYGLVSALALLSLVSGVLQVLDHLAPKNLVYLLVLVGIRFGMLSIAIFVVLRTYLGQFVTKAPTPVFGGYPQQQYGGQPYPQPPYQPPAPATPATAAPAAPAQAATAAQYGYAQQQSAQQQAGYTQQYGYGQQQAAQQQAAQQQAAPAGGYYGGQPNAPTSAAPASGAPASSPPASSPPATAGTYGQPADQQGQQRTQAPPQQATGWPPTPSASATQWPPTPTSKPASSQAPGEEVQHTQVIKPEHYRGNAST